MEMNLYLALEPDALVDARDPDRDAFLASIAVSMKRIADALEKGATVVAAADDIVVEPPPFISADLGHEQDNPACLCTDCIPF